jgi:hypothetical protein
MCEAVRAKLVILVATRRRRSFIEDHQACALRISLLRPFHRREWLVTAIAEMSRRAPVVAPEWSWSEGYIRRRTTVVLVSAASGVGSP